MNGFAADACSSKGGKSSRTEKRAATVIGKISVHVPPVFNSARQGL